MNTLLLIDSHALLHRFYHALPPLTSPSGDAIHGVYGICGVLARILEGNGLERPTYIAAALDRPEPTFRKAMYTDYKIHRPVSADGLITQIKMLPAMFEAFGVKAISVAGFEADDVIGTLVERFKKTPNLRIIILTGDHDVFQLVEDDRVVADIIKSGMNNLTRYNEAAVLEKFGLPPSKLPDYKALVGDASDNIKGAKGVGPETARKLLQEFGSLETLYEDIGLVKRALAEKLLAEKETVFLSRTLSTIRRDVPIALDSLEHLRATPQKDKLHAFLTSLGFQSLMNRMAL